MEPWWSWMVPGILPLQYLVSVHVEPGGLEGLPPPPLPEGFLPVSVTIPLDLPFGGPQPPFKNSWIRHLIYFEAGPIVRIYRTTSLQAQGKARTCLEYLALYSLRKLDPYRLWRVGPIQLSMCIKRPWEKRMNWSMLLRQALRPL